MWFQFILIFFWCFLLQDIAATDEANATAERHKRTAFRKKEIEAELFERIASRWLNHGEPFQGPTGHTNPINTRGNVYKRSPVETQGQSSIENGRHFKLTQHGNGQVIGQGWGISEVLGVGHVHRPVHGHGHRPGHLHSHGQGHGHGQGQVHGHRPEHGYNQEHTVQSWGISEVLGIGHGHKPGHGHGHKPGHGHGHKPGHGHGHKPGHGHGHRPGHGHVQHGYSLLHPESTREKSPLKGEYLLEAFMANDRGSGSAEKEPAYLVKKSQQTKKSNQKRHILLHLEGLGHKLHAQLGHANPEPATTVDPDVHRPHGLHFPHEHGRPSQPSPQPDQFSSLKGFHHGLFLTTTERANLDAAYSVEESLENTQNERQIVMNNTQRHKEDSAKSADLSKGGPKNVIHFSIPTIGPHLGEISPELRQSILLEDYSTLRTTDLENGGLATTQEDIDRLVMAGVGTSVENHRHKLEHSDEDTFEEVKKYLEDQEAVESQKTSLDDENLERHLAGAVDEPEKENSEENSTEKLSTESVPTRTEISHNLESEEFIEMAEEEALNSQEISDIETHTKSHHVSQKKLDSSEEDEDGHRTPLMKGKEGGIALAEKTTTPESLSASISRFPDIDIRSHLQTDPENNDQYASTPLQNNTTQGFFITTSKLVTENYPLGREYIEETEETTIGATEEVHFNERLPTVPESLLEQLDSGTLPENKLVISGLGTSESEKVLAVDAPEAEDSIVSEDTSHNVAFNQIARELQSDGGSATTYLTAFAEPHQKDGQTAFQSTPVINEVIEESTSETIATEKDTDEVATTAERGLYDVATISEEHAYIEATTEQEPRYAREFFTENQGLIDTFSSNESETTYDSTELAYKESSKEGQQNLEYSTDEPLERGIFDKAQIDESTTLPTHALETPLLTSRVENPYMYEPEKATETDRDTAGSQEKSTEIHKEQTQVDESSSRELEYYTSSYQSPGISEPAEKLPRSEENLEEEKPTTTPLPNISGKTLDPTIIDSYIPVLRQIVLSQSQIFDDNGPRISENSIGNKTNRDSSHYNQITKSQETATTIENTKGYQEKSLNEEITEDQNTSSDEETTEYQNTRSIENSKGPEAASESNEPIPTTTESSLESETGYLGTYTDKPDERFARLIPPWLLEDKTHQEISFTDPIQTQAPILKATVEEPLDLMTVDSDDGSSSAMDALSPVIPVIVEDLRAGVVTDEEKRVLSQVFGTRWLDIVKMAKTSELTKDSKMAESQHGHYSGLESVEAPRRRKHREVNYADVLSDYLQDDYDEYYEDAQDDGQANIRELKEVAKDHLDWKHHRIHG